MKMLKRLNLYNTRKSLFYSLAFNIYGSLTYYYRKIKPIMCVFYATMTMAFLKNVLKAHKIKKLLENDFYNMRNKFRETCCRHCIIFAMR